MRRPHGNRRPYNSYVGLGQYQAGERFLSGMLEWCAVWDPPRDAMTFLLDGFERSLSELSPGDFDVLRRAREARSIGVRDLPFWRHRQARSRFGESSPSAPAGFIAFNGGRACSRARSTRLTWSGIYGLLRGFERRSAGAGTEAELDDFMAAYRLRLVDESELIDLLVGPAQHSVAAAARSVGTEAAASVRRASRAHRGRGQVSPPHRRGRSRNVAIGSRRRLGWRSSSGSPAGSTRCPERFPR